MPGNGGTGEVGINVPLDPLDFAMTGKFCLDNDIGLVVVGPEDPLVKGIRNFFESDNKLKTILFVGPSKEGAIMEGSKDWSKSFMKKYQIPTAASETFSFQNIHQGLEYVANHSIPVVLKADGLAAGKGVLICQSNQEATEELNAMIRDSKFGAASAKVVVESYLDGIELSVFVLTDGETYKILPEAKDYKRIGEGETGLNTGGMGAISPVPFADQEFMRKVEERVIVPTIHGLKQEGIRYQGFIFIGLMKVGEDPFVIEYNCRMGDPETEVVLPRISSDFGELMIATAKGELHKVHVSVDSRHAAAVMLVSGGYPGDYAKGMPITGLDIVEDCLIFHAGTRSDNGTLVTNGGRVMALTCLHEQMPEALRIAKANAVKVNFEGKYYRRDIGFEFV